MTSGFATVLIVLGSLAVVGLVVWLSARASAKAEAQAELARAEAEQARLTAKLAAAADAMARRKTDAELRDTLRRHGADND
jgi:type II secretory pathway pseudopilin PulG